MKAFLAEQADFVLFFYGLAFILLGLTCFAIARHAAPSRSWAVLGAFGLLHGASEWLDLSALALGDTPGFAAVRTAVLAVSFALLLEFARRELKALGYRVPGAWIYAPVLLLVALVGAREGLSAANAVARYSMGFTGAGGASLVLILRAGALGGASRRLALMAAVDFALYGIAAGVIVPAAPLWPADAINQEWFLDATGVPIQLVRGLLACCAAVAIWGIWGQKLMLEVASARYTRFLRRQFVATVAVMGTILVLGWGLTEYFGIVHKQHLKQETNGDLDLLASSLSGLTAPLDAVGKSLAGQPMVRAALAGDRHAVAQLTPILSLDVEASGAQGGIILDKSGTVVAAAGRILDHAAASSPAAISDLARALSGHGARFAFDAARNAVVYATSYPVRGAGGDVVGVAVLSLSLGRFETKLETFRTAIFFVDRQGRIALTNRPQLLRRAIWPAPAAAATGPSARAEAPPVLEREVEDTAWAVVDGQPTYVRRRAVADSDWSLVIFEPVEGIYASRVLGIAITLLAAIMVLIYVVARERAVHDHVQMDRRLELEELARDLDHKASTDPLTGLSNRLKFDAALAREIRRARRFSTPLSLILYDVDNFKQINDTYGHRAGDQVLIKLSRFVAERMRATDLVARWGGEEFAVLVPHTDGPMAVRFASLLRAAIEVVDLGEAGLVTCSFGVAELAPGEGAEHLVQRADAALYRAKVLGRNRVELAPAPDEAPKEVRNEAAKDVGSAA